MPESLGSGQSRRVRASESLVRGFSPRFGAFTVLHLAHAQATADRARARRRPQHENYAVARKA
eukprot:6537751-Prymnesium_polylepis.1